MLEILDEVIFNHIFPNLHVNDILRLRRVCKSIKHLADDYLRLHGNIKTYIRVSPDKFIGKISGTVWKQSDPPYNQLYNHPNCISTSYSFFESFPKLEHLEIVDLCERGWILKKKKRKAPSEPVEIFVPSTFKTLKGLQIDNYCCRKNVRSAELLWKFVNECSRKLEYFHHPWFEDDMLNQLPNLPEGRFGYIRGIIERRHELYPNEPNLKFYNLRQFYDKDESTIREFYDLVTICSKYGVKLQNVQADIIERLMDLETWDMDQHTRKLSNVLNSVHFLETACFVLEMPHLEKILISEEHGTFCCNMPDWEFPRQEWPNLKDLTLWVDTGEMGTWSGVPIVDTRDLLDFFFVGIRREKLERLELYFYLNSRHREDELPYPRIRDVCSSCPNLKILNIGRWPGSNKAISKLWGNLPLLEDVTFDQCEELGNVAFVGKDVENPGFLKMKRLRRLKLEGLEVMPKITDTLFVMVLRHMPIRELYLCSRMEPVKSITMNGLKSLKTGSFAESIEKFPLKKEIQLHGVSEEEMSQLENEFRSSQMM